MSDKSEHTNIPYSLLYARRLRENQTFDLYAQRIENIHRGYVSGRYSWEDANHRVALVYREIDFVQKAIKKAQEDFKDSLLPFPE